jgi:hypothetical protein
LAGEARARIATQKLLAVFFYGSVRESAREAGRSLPDQSQVVQCYRHLNDDVTAYIEQIVANDLLVREPFVGLSHSPSGTNFLGSDPELAPFAVMLARGARGMLGVGIH